MIEIMGEGLSDFCIYFGRKGKSRRFIGFHFPLHTGWCSNMGMERRDGWRIKGGWEYYRPAILVGRTVPGSHSRWIVFPTVYIPARWVYRWRMRKRAFRKAMREDAKLIKENNHDQKD